MHRADRRPLRPVERVLAFVLAVSLATPPSLAEESTPPSAEPSPQAAAAPMPEASGESYRNFPDWAGLITNIPSNYAAYFRNLGSAEWYTYAGIAAATAAFLPYDQSVTDNSKSYALKHRIMVKGSQEDTFVDVPLTGDNSVALRGPTNLNGVFWYFGDGLISAGFAAGFASYGYLSDNKRAAHVSLQIFESLLLSGPTVLAIKMATGRESPARATRKGGKWQGYPGAGNYFRDQSKYYSYPSGHTATAVSTLTVIAENYTEKAWIVPVGATMVGLLMFALMNVGSHWPSDYPLAVFIGYSAAHTVVSESKARDRLEANDKAAERFLVGRDWRWEGVRPACGEAFCGLTTAWRF